jgi:hypothetical protein
MKIQSSFEATFPSAPAAIGLLAGIGAFLLVFFLHYISRIGGRPGRYWKISLKRAFTSPSDFSIAA